MSVEEKNENSALLSNYHALICKVDSLCSEIVLAGGDSIACRQGCDGCCRHFSVSWVEAYNIAVAVAGLEKTCAKMIRDRAGNFMEREDCPLLEGGSCLLYDQRPIICRTHGLPILIKNGESTTIDYCPKNYRNADSIEGRHIIDLDRLNDTLAAINSLFIKDFFHDEIPPVERLSIAQAVMLSV